VPVSAVRGSGAEAGGFLAVSVEGVGTLGLSIHAWAISVFRRQKLIVETRARRKTRTGPTLHMESAHPFGNLAARRPSPPPLSPEVGERGGGEGH
jgi:hypothetical protein